MGYMGFMDPCKVKAPQTQIVLWRFDLFILLFVQFFLLVPYQFNIFVSVQPFRLLTFIVILSAFKKIVGHTCFLFVVELTVYDAQLYRLEHVGRPAYQSCACQAHVVYNLRKLV